MKARFLPVASFQSPNQQRLGGTSRASKAVTSPACSCEVAGLKEPGHPPAMSAGGKPLRAPKSAAPWAAACARRIGRGTRRSASPRRRRRSSAALRFAPSRRRPPSQPHGDPAAPGWHRARLNRRPNAAFADALRGAAGRRALSLRSASGSRSFASATSRSAGSAWPGARGARALAPACRGVALRAVTRNPHATGTPARTPPLRSTA